MQPSALGAKRSPWFDVLRTVFVGLLFLAGLYAARMYSYLLFHSLAEAWSIALAVGIFLLLWNARRYVDNAYALFVSIAYLFVAIIDLVHMLAYKGMGVFPEFDSNQATQLWIAARALQAGSLFVAPFLAGRRLRVNRIILVYAALTVLLLGLIWAGLFPTAYQEGVGLTPFKRIGEYAISAVFLASLGLLWWRRRALGSTALWLLVGSIVATVGSELAFTFYVDVYDLSNMAGHLLKVIAYYLVYVALVRIGMREPYEHLLGELQHREGMLVLRTRELQERVRWLDCLYGISALVEKPGASLEQILQGAVDLIPPAWQYPQDTGARVVLDGQEYHTANFRETTWQQSADLLVRGQPAGLVQVCYLELKPKADEGPFLKEERRLLNAIAERLGKVVERVQAEEMLRESEELFRSMFKSASAGIVLLEPEGQIRLPNEAFREFLGYAEDELVHAPFTLFIYPADQDRASYADLFRGEMGRSTCDLRFVRRDRQIVWGRLGISAVRRPDGQMLYAVAMLEDVTERKRGEEVLLTKEAAIASAFDGIAIAGLDGTLAYVNRAMLAMWGYETEAEVLGRSAIDFWRYPGEAAAALSSLTARGHWAGEQVAQRKDGSFFDAQVASSIVRNREDQAICMLSIIRDVSERKRVEEEHRLNELRLNSLLVLGQKSSSLTELEMMQLAVEEAVRLTSSQIGYLHFVNPDEQTIQLVAWSEEAKKQCTVVHDNHYPLDQAGVWADSARLRQPVIHNNYQALPEKKGYPQGHAHLIRHASVPIFDRDRVAVILGVGNKGADYDETDVRQLLLVGNEAMRILRRKRIEDALQASLREKEVLLQEVHHRVKNNLQIISSLLDIQSMMLADPQTLSVLQESRNRIRAMALVHNQLYQSTDLARVSASEYLENVVGHLQGVYGRQEREVHLHLDVEGIPLNLDTAIPCGLIVNELVTNAYKYAFPPEREAGGEVRVALHRRDGHLTLEVQDNGVGLPAGLDLEATTSLGLRLVNMLTRQLEGTLEVVQNGGTTFRITLPAVESAS